MSCGHNSQLSAKYDNNYITFADFLRVIRNTPTIVLAQFFVYRRSIKINVGKTNYVPHIDKDILQGVRNLCRVSNVGVR